MVDCKSNLLCAGLLLIGCAPSGMVKVPSRDATPPLAILDVVGKDTTVVLASGETPTALSMGPRDSLVLIALGEDRDGGLKDLALHGNVLATCRDGKSGKEKSRTESFRREKIIHENSDQRAPAQGSTRFILRASDFRRICPGQGITSLVGEARTRAVNYSGGSTASPRLEFRLNVSLPADTLPTGKTPTDTLPTAAASQPRKQSQPHQSSSRSEHDKKSSRGNSDSSVRAAIRPQGLPKTQTNAPAAAPLI